MFFPGPQASPPGLLTSLFPVDKHQLVGQVLILEVQLMSFPLFAFSKCFFGSPGQLKAAEGVQHHGQSGSGATWCSQL